MRIPFLQRLQAAAGLILKGSVGPWDRLLPDSSGISAGRMREPYRESVWVHAAIRHISRPCAAVSMQISSSARRRDGQQSLISDPRVDAWMAAPAVGMASWSEFLLATIGWRKMAGEAFWLLGDDAIVPFPEVRATLPQVVLARPDRMRHICDGDTIVGWEFTDGAGRRHNLLPEQVIHLRQWNPYTSHRGLGEWETARLAAETDQASAQFQRNLAASNGDQGVYVVAKNGVPSDEQRKQITAILQEKRRLQQQGVFKPAFLTGDITVEDPKVRVVDAAFLDGRRMSAAEVFVAFGVPPSMAKEQASYSIGSASDYFRLILDTCIPESIEIAAAVTRLLTRAMGRQVFAWFAWDEHPVLQEVRKERMGSVDALWSKGVPLRTISDWLDLGLPAFPGDQQGWLPISVVPADSAAAIASDPGPEGIDSTPPSDHDQEDPPPQSVADPVQEAIRVLRLGRSAFRADRDVRAWQRHMRLRMVAVRAYERAFGRVLSDARRQVLRKLDAKRSIPPQDDFGGVDPHDSAQGSPDGNGSARQGRPVGRSGALDLMWDPDEFESGLIEGFRRVSGDTLNTAGQQLYRELGKDDPFTYPPEGVVQFIAQRKNLLTGIADDVFESIRGTLDDGLAAGESIAQLADRVRAQFNEMGRGRARRIAMTETAAAYGVARQEGMRQAGVRWKRWLTSGGDNVRPVHMEANNQTVPADEAFDVGGEQLMHPGDPSGSPANIINCHCVAVAVADPEEGLNP